MTKFFCFSILIFSLSHVAEAQSSDDLKTEWKPGSGQQVNPDKMGKNGYAFTFNFDVQFYYNGGEYFAKVRNLKVFVADRFYYSAKHGRLFDLLNHQGRFKLISVSVNANVGHGNNMRTATIYTESGADVKIGAITKEEFINFKSIMSFVVFDVTNFSISSDAWPYFDSVIENIVNEEKSKSKIAELINEGDDLYDQKNFQGALATYKSAQKLDANNPSLNNKIARVEKELSDSKNVSQSGGSSTGAKVGVPGAPGVAGTVSGNISTGSTAQMTDAQKARQLANEGNSLYQQGKYSEALQKYNEAQKLDPGNQVIINNRNNAIDAVNQQNEIESQRKLSEAKLQGQTEIVNTYANIATEVLQAKGGRFGLAMMNIGSTFPLGVTWGDEDIVHINFIFDMESFNSFGISLDMLGIDLLKDVFQGGDGYMGIFPTIGFVNRFPDVDKNGDPIPGAEEFNSIQLGIMGIIELDGIYMKAGFNFDAFIIDGKDPGTGSFLIGIGFGLN